MARRIRRNVGIIGLGIIGSRVADNLRRKGYPVFVWNRTPRPVPNFVGSPIELAELCDLIQLFVSDDDALLEMVQRIKSALTKQHVVIASSTVSPDTMRAAAEIVERRGGRLVDAPFTGSKAAAASGELVYYIGGEPAALDQARPVLEGSAKEVVEIGTVGQASAMKIATNIITAAVVQGAAEALALVVDAGIAPEKFLTAMRSNGSHSKTLEMKLPKMLAGDFEPHFSVKHMLKDMAIASRVARSLGGDFPVVDAARHALQDEERAGRAGADYSCVIQKFFPHGGPLVSPQADAEAPEDQPDLAGLDSRQARDQAGTERGDLAVPTTRAPDSRNGGGPAERAPILEPHDDAATVAVEMAVGPSEHAASTAEGAEPAHATKSSGEENREDTGGLFRRFIRRGSGY